MKRQRGRNRNNNNSNKSHNGNRQMESNGPDTKVRGSATQIHDKYVNLARDASVSGNRVKAESYRQHAEHYLRLMNAQEAAKQAADAAREARQSQHNNEASNTSSSRDEGNDDGSNERKSRRHTQRPRRNKNDSDDMNSKGLAENSASKNTASNDIASSDSVEALEVVKPKPVRKRAPKPIETTKASGETENRPDAETPTRRRKAPARAKSDSETISAAE